MFKKITVKKYIIGIYAIKDAGNNKFPIISHDHNITIVKDGKIFFFIQTERITRNKYDNNLGKIIDKILKDFNINLNDCDFVFTDNILGRSFISEKGTIRFETNLNDSLTTGIEKGQLFLYGKHRPAYILNHELAHLYSNLPFYGNFKNNSLLVHFDGGASKSNFSAWVFKDNKIKLLEFNWDLKQVSSFFNSNPVSFKTIGAKISDQNSAPGKIMGLAAFGSYNTEIEEWLNKNNYFADTWKNSKSFFESIKQNFNIKINDFDTKNKFLQDCLATMQQIFTDKLINKLKLLQQKYNFDNLYYSGGSALNIVTNTKIVESNLFKQVFIPPTANDSGLSLGAAFAFELQKNNTPKIHSAYLNNLYVDKYSVSYSINDIKKTAQALLQNKILGIVNSSAEAGPRALGNRSIIALANSQKLAKKVSCEIKKREWYRPVAPIMLVKNTKYFTGKKQINDLSKFMLLDFKILAEKQKEIEGVVHINGTSRIQTVFNREQNSFIYDLLDYLDKNHNIKALINTSFNKQGEPIVHTIDDAKKTAKKIKLDGLIINGKYQNI